MRHRKARRGFDFLIYYLSTLKRGVILPRKHCPTSGHKKVLFNPKTGETKSTFKRFEFEEKHFMQQFKRITGNVG
jgi:hypothetical protein